MPEIAGSKARDGRWAEVALQQLAVACVQRRIGGREHVDRIAEWRHAICDWAARARRRATS